MSSADEEMQDASTVQTPAATLEAENEDEEAAGKIRMLPGGSETAASFEFLEEDHTLGNALRHIIMKNPQVEFCGYSIPHPAERKMNLRIQTYDEVNVQDVLEKGLNDLMDLCDVVVDKFVEAQRDVVENGVTDGDGMIKGSLSTKEMRG